MNKTETSTSTSTLHMTASFGGGQDGGCATQRRVTSASPIIISQQTTHGKQRGGHVSDVRYSEQSTGELNTRKCILIAHVSQIERRISAAKSRTFQCVHFGGSTAPVPDPRADNAAQDPSSDPALSPLRSKSLCKRQLITGGNRRSSCATHQTHGEDTLTTFNTLVYGSRTNNSPNCRRPHMRKCTLRKCHTDIGSHSVPSF